MQDGALEPLPERTARLQATLYADDAVIFANPVRQEIDFLMQLLSDFTEASGLCMNQLKSSTAPINCEDVDLTQVLEGFGGSIVSFPVRYLGLLIRLQLIYNF